MGLVTSSVYLARAKLSHAQWNRKVSNLSGWDGAGHIRRNYIVCRPHAMLKNPTSQSQALCMPAGTSWNPKVGCEPCANPSGAFGIKIATLHGTLGTCTYFSTCNIYGFWRFFPKLRQDTHATGAVWPGVCTQHRKRCLTQTSSQIVDLVVSGLMKRSNVRLKGRSWANNNTTEWPNGGSQDGRKADRRDTPIADDIMA